MITTQVYQSQLRKKTNGNYTKEPTIIHKITNDNYAREPTITTQDD